MSAFRKFAVLGLVASSLALGAVASTTDAMARGGGGHGGGDHGGGGHDRGGYGHSFGGWGYGGGLFDRGGFGFRGADRYHGYFYGRPYHDISLFGDDDYDNYFYLRDQCRIAWRHDRSGHLYRVEICP